MFIIESLGISEDSIKECTDAELLRDWREQLIIEMGMVKTKLIGMKYMMDNKDPDFDIEEYKANNFYRYIVSTCMVKIRRRICNLQKD